MSSVNPVPSLTQAAFLVLLALASGERHGYAVMQFAEQTTDGRIRLPPGTLYRTISRLVADGFVEEIEGQDRTLPMTPGAATIGSPNLASVLRRRKPS